MQTNTFEDLIDAEQMALQLLEFRLHRLTLHDEIERVIQTNEISLNR